MVLNEMQQLQEDFIAIQDHHRTCQMTMVEMNTRLTRIKSNPKYQDMSQEDLDILGSIETFLQ